MTEPTIPTPDEPNADRPASDETFTWTTDQASGGSGSADAHGTDPDGSANASSGTSGASAATAILESVREAVDDLAERATPTVREFSARAAEFAAVAADRAAPFARRAGEVTSDASAKLATRSRSWAADIRASLDDGGHRRQARARQGRRSRGIDPGDAASGSRRRHHADGRTQPGLSLATYTPPMSVRPIVLLGDPRLRLKGKPVDSFGKYLHELLDDLAHTMRDAPGVGLAAPQLGEAMQACVIEVEGQLHELVNPRIVRSDGRRPRPRGVPLDPGLRRLRDPPRARVGRRPEPPRQEDQGRRAPGCSGGRSSTSSTTSTASSTSTTSIRWTS